MDSSPKTSWGLLCLAVCITTLNQTQRYAFSYIASDSSLFSDTQMTTEEYGWISGPGLALPLIISTLTAGRLVDRLEKPKWVIVAASVLVSIFTALNALAQQFWHLLLLRSLQLPPVFTHLRWNPV